MTAIFWEETLNGMTVAAAACTLLAAACCGTLVSNRWRTMAAKWGAARASTLAAARCWRSPLLEIAALFAAAIPAPRVFIFQREVGMHFRPHPTDLFCDACELGEQCQLDLPTLSGNATYIGNVFTPFAKCHTIGTLLAGAGWMSHLWSTKVVMGIVAKLEL